MRKKKSASCGRNLNEDYKNYLQGNFPTTRQSVDPIISTGAKNFNENCLSYVLLIF